MASPTIEERVSRLEGGYEHLATKADLERLRADVARWLFKLGIALIGALIAGLGVAVAFLRFTG